MDTAGTAHCSMDTARILHRVMDTAGTLHRSMSNSLHGYCWNSTSMDTAGTQHHLHAPFDVGAPQHKAGNQNEGSFTAGIHNVEPLVLELHIIQGYLHLKLRLVQSMYWRILLK